MFEFSQMIYVNNDELSVVFIGQFDCFTLGCWMSIDGTTDMTVGYVIDPYIFEYMMERIILGR